MNCTGYSWAGFAGEDWLRGRWGNLAEQWSEQASDQVAGSGTDRGWSEALAARNSDQKWHLLRHVAKDQSRIPINPMASVAATHPLFLLASIHARGPRI